MIDWLTLHGLICFYDPKVIYNGATLELDENGEIKTEWKKPFAVEGSYSSKVYVRVDPRSPSAEMANGFSFGSLEISGNPSKLLEGHNLFGTNDVQGVARAMILHVFKKLSAKLSKETKVPYHKVRSGERIEGTMRKTIELVSNKYALVECNKDFTLVP